MKFNATIDISEKLQEAYVQGWNDAKAASRAAVAGIGDPLPVSATGTSSAPPFLKPTKTLKEQAFDYVCDHPGLPTADIANALQRLNPTVKRKSIRTSLDRLQGADKRLIKQGNRWFAT